MRFTTGISHDDLVNVDKFEGEEESVADGGGQGFGGELEISNMRE